LSSLAEILSADLLVDALPHQNLHLWLRHFDLDYYRNHLHDGAVADLARLDDLQIYRHFIHRGEVEGRAYNRYIQSFLEHEFYMLTYPELSLKNRHDALRHWMYYGCFQNRSPNAVSEMFLNSNIHLFQMGKVGSKSIESAINECSPNNFVPHLHFTSEMLKSYSRCYFSYPEVIRYSKSPIKFISGVRDPIGRCFSGMLEAAGSVNSSLTYKSIIEILSDESVRDVFFYNDIQRIIKWFDHKYFCNLDVYDSSFDASKGVGIYSAGRNEVFIYDIDKLDSVWTVLQSYLEMNLQRKRINTSSEKPEGVQEVIDLFKKTKFRKAMIEDIFKSRYCQFFFSERKRNQMLLSYI
jgi:hypothetical protein